jgi:hypothetical protein
MGLYQIYANFMKVCRQNTQERKESAYSPSSLSAHNLSNCYSKRRRQNTYRSSFLLCIVTLVETYSMNSPDHFNAYGFAYRSDVLENYK